MTPQQAAKACMARVFFRLESGECTGEFIPMRTVAEVEREFTEIISQVTPDTLLGRFSGPVTQGGSAHHLSESQAENRRAFIPTGVCIPRNDEDVSKEVLAECGYADDAPTNNLAGYYAMMMGSSASPTPDASACFPQEIVEPQPKPWWKTLWAYVLNREP